MEKSSGSSGGLGCLNVILILLIALKLIGIEPVADWSWWTVLIPLWLEVGIVVFLLVILGGLEAIFDAVEKIK